MGKSYVLMLFVLLSARLTPARVAEAKPVYKWVSTNEYYFLLPASRVLAIFRKEYADTRESAYVF